MATTWDPANKSSAITLSGGNLTATMNTPSGSIRANVRSTSTQSSGKWYFEAGIGAKDGSGGFLIGVGNASASLTTTLGDANSIVSSVPAGGTGIVRYNSSTLGNAANNALVVLQEVAVDLTGLLYWTRSSLTSDWNNGGTANPATGVGGFSLSGLSGPYYIWFGAFGNTPADICVLNTGATAFTIGTPPTGFSAWDPTAPAVVVTSGMFFAA